ncbi:MAG: HupE/UreJ family protein, partial [Gammaproteobacteria bacterium]|nr:HupE/UreJ family protein [Gammaproteobacteria bacterium]
MALVTPVYAHKPSDSYLTLNVTGNSIDGRWDIALRDLDYALGLDADEDGNITWGEVKVKRAEIAAYALARLRL